MDISRKLELAVAHIRSISTHDDDDAAVRSVALDRLAKCIEDEREGMKTRLQARVAAALAPPSKKVKASGASK